MPRPRADPCIELALDILDRAVKDWKRCNGQLRGYDGCRFHIEPNELIPLQKARAIKRNDLLLFFGGARFDFLFDSAVTKTTKDKMFKALGIPAREVAR